MHMKGRQERRFQVDLEHLENFRFMSQASEDDVLHGKPYLSDEPDPVGEAAGPSTPALLASSIAHCLSASLLETLKKSRITVLNFKAKGVGIVAENEEGLPRIKGVEVVLQPTVSEHSGRLKQCEAVFQQYCTVCSSLKPAIDIKVSVKWVYADSLVNA